MFDEVLIESAHTDRRKGGWITAMISAAIHILFIGAIIAAGMYVQENPEVIEKPITAFLAPAPPPPPPPPASGGGAPQQRVPIEPREPREQEFAQPRDTPRDVPVLEAMTLKPKKKAASQAAFAVDDAVESSEATFAARKAVSSAGGPAARLEGPGMHPCASVVTSRHPSPSNAWTRCTPRSRAERACRESSSSKQSSTGRGTSPRRAC